MYILEVLQSEPPRLAPYLIGNSHIEDPATSSIEVSYELLRYYENQCVCSITLDRILYETHHQ